MKGLRYDPNSLEGPVDERVVRDLSKNWALPAEYLDHQRGFHGGIPELCVFRVASGERKVGRFLTLFDGRSSLPGPPRPHFELSSMDERVMRGVVQLVDGEHATARALFGRLLPFAVVGEGADEMCLDRAYVDLLCFDQRDTPNQPSVVLWDSHQALTAYMDWEGLLASLVGPEQDEEDQSLSKVPWDSFLVPVAESFASFLDLLKPVGDDP